jgi:hypothetical protein
MNFFKMHGGFTILTAVVDLFAIKEWITFLRFRCFHFLRPKVDLCGSDAIIYLVVLSIIAAFISFVFYKTIKNY